MTDLPENLEVLNDIPFEPDITKIMKMLPMRGDKKRFEAIVQELLKSVAPVARPKAVYKVCHVDEKDGSSVLIEGERFTSPLLRDKVDKVERVFPFVVSCGREVDEIRTGDKDLIKDYCLDVIKNSVVFSAATYLNKYLSRRFAIAQLSSLNPGEAKSWPITQQKKIFRVLGDVEGMIGVKLTENCALVPTKSGSGILFPAETPFFGCQLCPQKRCMGRRAAYNEEMARKYAEEARALS